MGTGHGYGDRKHVATAGLLTVIDLYGLAAIEEQTTSESSRVRPHHLERGAYLYILGL